MGKGREKRRRKLRKSQKKQEQPPVQMKPAKAPTYRKVAAPRPEPERA